MPYFSRAQRFFVVSSLVLGGGCFTAGGSPLGDTGSEGPPEATPTTTRSGNGDGDGDGDEAPTNAETTSDPPPTAADDDSTTESPVACEEGSSCRPDPGPAWSGPFAVAAAAAGCGGAFPDAIQSLFAELNVGESTCTCTCGAPDVECSSQMSVVGYAELGCVSGQGSQPIGENQCYDTFASSHAVTLDDVSSSCADGRVTAVVPDPDYGVEAVRCEGAQSVGGCVDDERCVPEPSDEFSGGICYSREGDTECPDEFPEKTLYFTGLEDTRSCPATCSCTASPATCSVAVVGFANPGCSSPQGSVSTNSGEQVCAATNSTIIESIRPETVTVEDPGVCTEAPVSPSGEVAATGRVTVCCSG